MPLLRYAIYSQGVNLWLAPTADARDTWESLMKTVASEGRCFVLSANQAIKRKNLPEWVTGVKAQENTSTAQEINHPSLANGTSKAPLGGRRRSMSTRTEENHEIAWRSKDGTINEEAASEQADSSSAVVIDNTLPPTTTTAEDEGEQYVSAGGSCIISPLGKTLQGPVWEKEHELVYTEVDFDDCERGHLDFDAVGHYSRPDAFKLTVEGLDLNPPP